MSSKAISALSLRLDNAFKSTGMVRFGPIALMLVAVLLWVVSLPGINVARITDLGLIAALPLSTFVAFLLFTVSYCLALRRQPISFPFLLFHIVILIVMLYGITTFIEEQPRFSVSWVHAGITEHIMRTGQVATNLDARFSWPGFFILSAFFTQIAGLQNPVDFTAWAPVFFNLLYLGPLIMIFRSATNDKRLVWLGIWLFYLANWIGQDYFAPQAFNYFFYLIILGILLKWFKQMVVSPKALGPRWQRFGRFNSLFGRIYNWLTPADMRNSQSRPVQRAALSIMLVLFFVVVAASHQLTPFATLIAVTILIVFNRSSLRGLPIIMAVLTVTWISYMTVDYLSGHAESLLGQVGQVTETVSAGVTERLQGSPEHVFVSYMRLFVTFILWGSAFLGGLRRLHKGYWDLTYVLLAAAPFLTVGLQDYGGEIFLRIYLFGLPFFALFAAALFYTSKKVGRSWWTTSALAVVSLTLLIGFLFTRYGNERMDQMRPQEVTAVRYLYNIAKPDSLLVAASYNLPWKFQSLEQYSYGTVSPLVLSNDINAIVRLMKDKKYPEAYLILTESQKARLELFSGLTPAAWEQFENDLLKSGEFKQIFANDDAEIFALTNSGNGTKP